MTRDGGGSAIQGNAAITMDCSGLLRWGENGGAMGGPAILPDGRSSMKGGGWRLPISRALLYAPVKFQPNYLPPLRSASSLFWAASRTISSSSSRANLANRA